MTRAGSPRRTARKGLQPQAVTIETQTSVEGAAPAPGARRTIHLVKPGILVAGFNAVCTDAVGMALMGFDPAADRGTAPFENCDSTLRLAEELGVGTRDLKQIEVIGTPIEQAKFDIRAVPGGVPPGERRRAFPG